MSSKLSSYISKIRVLLFYFMYANTQQVGFLSSTLHKTDISKFRSVAHMKAEDLPITDPLPAVLRLKESRIFNYLSKFS